MEYKFNNSSPKDILSHFISCEKNFLISLKSKVDLNVYVERIFSLSIRCEAWSDDYLIGLIAFYVNKDFAYFSNVSIIESEAGKGIASILLSKSIDYIKERNITRISLDVDKENYSAIKLYEKFGFKRISANDERITYLLNFDNVFKWSKLGLIFNPTENKVLPWLDEYAQAPSTLLFDSFIRIYFSCRSKRDSHDQFISYSAFIDVDRNNLKKIIRIASKPVLELGEKGCFDEFGTYPISVIRRNDVIWAYYAGWTRCVSVPFNTSIGVAISKDNGLTFTKLGNGPVLSYSLEEPFILSVPKIRYFNNIYYLFYVCGKEWIIVDNKPEMSLKIRMAYSEDGLNWIKGNKNLIVDELNQNESQASPDVFFKNGKYHMFFDYWDPESFRFTKDRKIGYAYSYDLVNWTRIDTMAGIKKSGGSNLFDNEMVAYPHIFELDGNIYMLYLGNEVGRYGFGLARLDNILI